MGRGNFCSYGEYSVCSVLASDSGHVSGIQSRLAGIQFEEVSVSHYVHNFQLCNLCYANRGHANQGHANKSSYG